MDYIEYANNWAKSEVEQGHIMIGAGVVLLVLVFWMMKGENDLFKGMLIPLGLLTVVLIVYGGVIIYGRPAHAKQNIELYMQSKSKAIEKERAKHINDNKAGNTLMKFVYPGFIILSALMLFFVTSTYYRGMAIGFIVLFAATYVMDNGFVTRSNKYIEFLS